MSLKFVLKYVDPFPLSFRSNEVNTGVAAISVNNRIYWLLFDFNTHAHMWVRVVLSALSIRPIQFHILQNYFSVRCFGLLYRSRLLNSIWLNGRSNIISIVILTRANNRPPFKWDTGKNLTKNGWNKGDQVLFNWRTRHRVKWIPCGCLKLIYWIENHVPWQLHEQ